VVFSFTKIKFEPERREARAFSVSAAGGRFSEQKTAQRSKFCERKQEFRISGTARGAAKQLQIPPSPPNKKLPQVRWLFHLLNVFLFCGIISLIDKNFTEKCSEFEESYIKSNWLTAGASPPIAFIFS